MPVHLSLIDSGLTRIAARTVSIVIKQHMVMFIEVFRCVHCSQCELTDEVISNNQLKRSKNIFRTFERNIKVRN